MFFLAVLEIILQNIPEYFHTTLPVQKRAQKKWTNKDKQTSFFVVLDVKSSFNA